jgi:hypothetical protein
MSRRRKDYRVDSQPEHFTGAPIDTLMVRFPNEEIVETFDFQIYAARAEMAAVIALAFRMHGADKSPETRRTLFVSAVRQWFVFLDAHDPERRFTAGIDIDAALVRAYVAWLDARPARIATRYSLWSGMRSLFRWLLRHRADLVGGDLMLPLTQPLQTRPTLKLGWTRDLEGKHAPEALHAGGDRCEITAS